MQIEGILTQDSDIVLKKDVVDKLTEKLVKDNNKEVYNKLRTAKACKTRITNEAEKVSEEISILEAKFKENENEIQKLLLVVADATKEEANA